MASLLPGGRLLLLLLLLLLPQWPLLRPASGPCCGLPAAPAAACQACRPAAAPAPRIGRARLRSLPLRGAHDRAP